MTLEEAYGSVKKPPHMQGLTESEIEEILKDEVAENQS